MSSSVRVREKMMEAASLLLAGRMSRALPKASAPVWSTVMAVSGPSPVLMSSK